MASVVSMVEFIVRTNGCAKVIFEAMSPYPPYVGSKVVVKGMYYIVKDVEFNFDRKIIVVELVEDK